MAPDIATNTKVTLPELLDFVRPRHRAILLTRRSDGSPQGSPLTCGVDDSGRIVASTYPERAKTRNAWGHLPGPQGTGGGTSGSA
ncbi:hypothetical protein GCM10017776_21700 [Streptomyces griseoluteus]|nr:hypothetical protein GCM10017776_21700 [Streptomyces griseoluteus]